jgi:hypothetical protein
VLADSGVMDKLRSRLLASLIVILIIATAGVLYSFVGGFSVPASAALLAKGDNMLVSTYLPGLVFIMLLIFAIVYFEK